MRTWAEIDTEHWRYNFCRLADKVSPVQLLPVVKANGYGLGDREAVRTFQECGARFFAVSCLSEAMRLREIALDIDILVLGSLLPGEMETAVAADFIVSVSDVNSAAKINSIASRLQRRARIHLKVDSGMGRFGFSLDRAPDDIRSIAKLKSLQLHGIYSHFAASESVDSRTTRQLRNFRRLVHQLQKDGVVFIFRHIANSSAIAKLPEAACEPFNLVRAGIDLHGAYAGNNDEDYGLKPVYALKARLVSVRHLSVNATVSYGSTYEVSKPEGERIGIASIGYADGYPRSLSNSGEMLVHGQRCPVRGRVCMDFTMLSLDSVPEAEVGDEVVVIGSQGCETIFLSEVADAADTIPYELMCRLGPRVERIYC